MIEPCCADKSNRRWLETSTETVPQGVVVKTVEKCSVCNRKHYKMTVPPIHFGLTGQEAVSV